MNDELTPEMLKRLLRELEQYAITPMSIEEVEQIEQEYRECCEKGDGTQRQRGSRRLFFARRRFWKQGSGA